MTDKNEINALQETLYLTSIPGVHEKIIEGLNTPLDELVEDES